MKTGFITLLVVAGLATPASAQSIGGRYQVIGSNFNGSSYSGTVDIAATSDTNCRISWVTGPSTSRGICMRNGNVFSASYVLGNTFGLVVYILRPDGSLDGRWTVDSQSGVGTERLVPMR